MSALQRTIGQSLDELLLEHQKHDHDGDDRNHRGGSHQMPFRAGKLLEEHGERLRNVLLGAALEEEDRLRVVVPDAEAVEDDDEAIAEKMQNLTALLGEQMAKGAELDQLIRQKLGGLGYEF